MNDMPAPLSDFTPNVYFIDDSATMREVVKIAFRRESFNVITCADVTSAIAQFELIRPNAVISDVIMPDRDGYQLCEYVKQHADFGSTPVILLSGIVNRDVADKAHQVRADELIRKPFHPQQLVACVKKLLNLSGPEVEAPAASAPTPTPAPPPAPAQAPTLAPAGGAPNPLSQLFGFPAPVPARSVSVPPARTNVEAAPAKPAAQPPTASSAEVTKLRSEIRRLESLVKKLQAQLDTEHEYCAALESQLRAINVAE
jgi:DNA-binding response OmpR family regulator